jgi:oligopeptide/dipeptide ABC transporter ATP-binding protein
VLGNLVEVTNLAKYYAITRPKFGQEHKTVRAVDGVSFTIKEGETLTLVGESGSGKTTVAMLLARLIEPTSGKIFMQGQEVTNVGEQQLRKIRRNIQVVFQNPTASLNPKMNILEILEAPLKISKVTNPSNYGRTAEQLLERVGMTPPRRWLQRHPHELSGGQKQRVAIARALATQPRLLIADEPLSSLDMSVRAQILNLLQDLKEQSLLTYLFVTHDLATARVISDRIAVMFLGRIVEIASADELYENPLHPYTKALLTAVPVPNPHVKREKVKLVSEASRILIEGCHFRLRCPYAFSRCADSDPQLIDVGHGHQVACFLHA